MSRQPVYRIRHQNGVSTEVQLQPKQIGQRFPGSIITHRIKFNDEGHGTPIPYTGDQPEQEDDSAESAPESENKGGTASESTEKRESPSAEKSLPTAPEKQSSKRSK